MNKIKNYVNEKLDLFMAGFIPFLFTFHLGLLIAVILFPVNYFWFIPYLIYTFYDKSPEQGGRNISWLNDNIMHRRMRSYFNVDLVRETELDPSKNYLFNYHPHGIWGYGCQPVFRESNPQFKKLFPGIDIRVLTLNANFSPPIHREFMMGMGFCSCSKKSIKHLLSKGPGSSCILVPGGGAEALHSQDYKAELVLKNRLGFAKLALETGASLVPVYGFGETSTYKSWVPIGNYWYDQLQKLCKLGGFRLPIFYGRSLFSESIGFFPLKTKITVVVGAPIPVTKNLKPTQEEIEEVHTSYCEALINLYDKHKEKYHTGPLPVPDLKLV